uniref:C-type lectin domain-containing protein n=1 Tax=Steinernema glaseri TaxID=37863 RepID=A0A1I7ZNA9_9BILA
MKYVFVLFVLNTFVTSFALRNLSELSGKWIAYGDHVYLFNKNWLTWRDGEYFCVSVGGHLASIHSEDEAKAVARIKAAYTIGQHAWLGGFKLSNSTQFLWNDGTAWNYSNWYSDASRDTGRDCVATWYSGHEVWGNYDCAGAGIPSICKKKADSSVNRNETISISEL